MVIIQRVFKYFQQSVTMSLTPYETLKSNAGLFCLSEQMERLMYKTGVHLKRERGSSFEGGFMYGIKAVLDMLEKNDPETVRHDLQRYISEHENPAPLV
jgi:hypothetical protein